MAHMEINFDGIVGPNHNFAGLSLGNVASAANAGARSEPRGAALQGIAKMRRMLDLGLPQGLLPPPERPNLSALRALGFDGAPHAACARAWREDPALFATLMSASSMWAANAATVSPSPDTADGRCHLTVANLAAMPHRAFEPAGTLATLQRAFGDAAHFAVHPALPGGQHFGDEGAANHMRLAPSHGEPGIEIFVYGAQTVGRYPARQRRRASEAVARLHGLDPARALFWAQSDAAIQAGAFHNDVVAVANERVLFTHACAFEDQPARIAELMALAPWVRVIEAPAEAVSLEDAIASYLFNSQLVTLPDGRTALILPKESQDNPRVWAYVASLTGQCGGIDEAIVVDVRESMRNGGGPACLRLRVQVSEAQRAAIDPRFLADHARLDALEAVVQAHWPAAILPTDLGDPALWDACLGARAALLEALGF